VNFHILIVASPLPVRQFAQTWQGNATRLSLPAGRSTARTLILLAIC